MKVKVLYKAIDLRGNQVKLKIDHECPNFKEEQFTFQGYDFVKSVSSQVIDWLDEQDKMNIIYDNDLHCIIDYELIENSVGAKKLSKKELFNGLTDLLITDEKMNIDVKLTYVGMYNSIKSLKVGRQLEVVLSSLGLSYMTKSDAYQHMIDILKTPTEEIRKMIN